MTQRVVNYTYGTGNPVLPDGSIDVRDGIDNLQSFDIFMNADEDAYNQRYGEIVKTRAGAVRAVGIQRIGDFNTGCTVTERNQGVLYETDGTVYVWLGALPKSVPPASSPTTTGGIGPSGWLDIGDASLRSNLAAPGGAGLVGGLPVFVTATKYAGGATTSSTINDAAIIAAINDAITTGSYVYWPAVYEVQGNIPNFHSVRHDGPGGIKRGSDTFRVHPLEWHTNFTYVAKTGSDSNDGLSANFPTMTIAKMFAILQGPSIIEMLRFGHWVTNIGAGVYTESAAWTKPVATMDWVEFVGATQISGLPDTVIDGTGSSANGGMYFQQGPSQIKLSNIKSRNFTGTSVASGIVFDGRGINRAWVVNCHGIANLWAGVNADSIGQFIVTGGEYRSNTQYQIRIRAGVGFSIGAYSGTNRVNVGNGTGVAIQVRDACTGHIDYTDIHDTATGIQIANASRVTIVNGTFNTCTVGYSVEAVSTCAHDTTTTFTGVSQMFQTKQNGVAGQDSATNYGGEGLAYDSFNDRYEIGRRLWSTAVAPTSATAYAFMTSKTGTVDYNFLVPTGSTIRLVGGDVSDRTHSYLALDLPNLRIRGVVKNAVCFNATSTAFAPGADNTSNLGTSGARWSVVYAATGAINTSDAREKTDPLTINDAVLDAWSDVRLISYQWLESIRLKGDSARWHFGVIAQHVRDSFAAHGLNGCDFGLLCYDEWDDEYEQEMALRENPETGEMEEYSTGEMKLVRAAGNRWGIRHDQCLFVEAAYQRRNYQRVNDRLSAIEDRLSRVGL